jgi:glutathione S-transferase
LARKNPDFDLPAIERSAAQFTSMVGIVDAQLERTGGYVAAERFTLADIPIGLSLHRWRSMPMTRPVFANVDRYYELLPGRPGFVRAASTVGRNRRITWCLPRTQMPHL